MSHCKSVVLALAVVVALGLVTADAAWAQQGQQQGQQQWQRVHGTVQSVSGNNVTVKTDDGRTLTVDAAQVAANVRGALTPNERVTLIGFAGSDASKFTARFIQQDSSDPSRGGTIVGQQPSASPGGTAGAAAGGDWKRVRGTVQSVSGTTVTVKADDGRMLTVDANKVGAEIRGALHPNDSVTLIGFAGADSTKFTAEYIQKEAPGAATVDEKAWQRIHGTVSSVSGTTLSLKADDGRTLSVDAKDIGEQVRSSLKAGDGATVIGFYHGDQNTLSARYIQKDGSPSASPASGQK